LGRSPHFPRIFSEYSGNIGQVGLGEPLGTCQWCLEQAFGPRPGPTTRPDIHMATQLYLPLLEGSSLCLPVPQPEARAKSRTIQLGSYQHEWTNPITTTEAMDSFFLNSSTPAAKKLWSRATSLKATPPANYITSERNIQSSDCSPPTWPTPSHQAASISLNYDATHTKQCYLIALLMVNADQ
jgi:hypothetical protein